MHSASISANGHVSSIQGLTPEEECQLSPNDISMLETALGSLDNGGIMMHRLQASTGLNAARTADQEGSQQSVTTACPYVYNSVSLGGNTFPETLLNATCLPTPSHGCQLDSTSSAAGVPVTTTCHPQFYHVPIIRYPTLRIQTAHCVIKDFTVEQVEIATGCTCVFD